MVLMFRWKVVLKTMTILSTVRFSLTVRFVSRFNYRHVSTVALVVIVLMVLLMTGWIGLFIAAVGTGIGLLPVLFGSRRLNCLGILLLPIACNMSGFGYRIVDFLGLT